MSYISQLGDLRYQTDETLRMNRNALKNLRETNLRNQEGTYDSKSDCHEKQAWQHSANALVALMQIFTVTFDEDWRNTFTAINQFTQQTTSVALEFSKTEMNNLDGRLNELNEALKSGGNREDEIRRLMQEIDQMLEAAIERANRSKSSVFNPSS